MAARRERERRRPGGERRYRFGTPEAAVEPDEKLVEEDEVAAPVEAPARPSPAAREAAVTAQPDAPARGGTKTAHKPFSAYKEEYGYVFGDLRRIGIVIGSLLLILIVLYVVLPLLIH